MKAVRALLRAIFWNDDPWTRWLLLGMWANNVCQFFWGRSPWSVLPVMAVVVHAGVFSIHSLRVIRREKLAFKTLEKEGGFWASEMAKHLFELHAAEERFATQAEKDEIIERLNEAKRRCEREIAVWQKERR